MFINSHLAVSKADHGARSGDLYADQDDTRLIERDAPALGAFLPLLKRVGGAYGWNRRPKYLDFPDLSTRLAAPQTRFFDIVHKGQSAGYALITAYDTGLSSVFDQKSMGQSVIEIENFGLFQGQTGHNVGDDALELLLKDLFKDHETVYLTTRSTNHPKVLGFYLDHGFQILRQDICPDDLVPAPYAPAGSAPRFKAV